MRRFHRYTDDLLRRPEVTRLSRRTNHHFTRSRLEHCVATAKLAYHTARVTGADVRTTTRAALLHDLFFERRDEHLNRVGADVHHYRISAANARGLGESRAVVDAVATHMWPWGSRPRSREAWIVWMSDNVVWVWDLLSSAGRYVRKKFYLFLYGSMPARFEYAS